MAVYQNVLKVVLKSSGKYLQHLSVELADRYSIELFTSKGLLHYPEFIVG
jgi:hypothetical protein